MVLCTHVQRQPHADLLDPYVFCRACHWQGLLTTENRQLLVPLLVLAAIARRKCPSRQRSPATQLRPGRNPKPNRRKDLIKGSCPQQFQPSKQIIQSSFPLTLLQQTHISPSKNRLVYAAYHAYSTHHNLTLRPEDIWLAILCQTGFFINAHADKLRHLFVSHEGSKELTVLATGDLDDVDLGLMARRMTSEIQQNVVDPDLRAWITPSFSTTTNNGRIVSAILMMGAMQKYFSYTFHLSCGIPAVTLLGERGDWVDIQARLEKLKDLGPEAEMFGESLEPILRYFIETFDHPESPGVKDFWSKIAHQTGDSGTYHLSGWITAFCFWDDEGRSLYEGCAQPPVSSEPFEGRAAWYELDGVFYHRVDTDDIPSGTASVLVMVDDNGVVYHTRVVAGSADIQATSDVAEGEEGESRSLNCLQPAVGWWMIEWTLLEKERHPRLSQ